MTPEQLPCVDVADRDELCQAALAVRVAQAQKGGGKDTFTPRTMHCPAAICDPAEPRNAILF
ncbi:MAG TPA: hypothetical protein VNG04_10285, partial [Candidatus Acidoferrum sp.]|nr:hypothetical protein [Candidatus Acidoferrum sp.]